MTEQKIKKYRLYVDPKYTFFLLNTMGWVLVAAVAQVIIFTAFKSTPLNHLNNLIIYISGYLTSLILYLHYRRIEAVRLSKVKTWIYIFALCLLYSNIWLVIDFVIYALTMSTFEKLFNWIDWPYYANTIFMGMIRLVPWSLIYFVSIILLERKQLADRKIQAELDLKNLEIKMLRYQLNPHFLFNSLNSIRALMLKDVKRSRQMISELSEFLRYSLVSKNNFKISLKQEIEAVKHFCVIEKIRFEDRLEINFSIDSETENKLVPPLILHPLVENAIKYGMETNPNVLKVGIATFIENDKFVIEINNNGKWLDETERSKIRIAGTNTGLENVRQILQNTYYLKHSFAIFTDSGVKIKISIDLDEVTPNA